MGNSAYISWAVQMGVVDLCSLESKILGNPKASLMGQNLNQEQKRLPSKAAVQSRGGKQRDRSSLQNKEMK